MKRWKLNLLFVMWLFAPILIFQLKISMWQYWYGAVLNMLTWELALWSNDYLNKTEELTEEPKQ
jgi:hypothetical protein